MLVYTFLPSDLWKASPIVFLAGFNLFKSSKNAVRLMLYTFLASDLWKGSSIVFLAGFNLFKSPKKAVRLMFLSHVI